MHKCQCVLYTGFLVIAIVPWLFSLLIVGIFGVALISDNSILNQTTSCVAAPSATYSASVIDNATPGCFFQSQLIAPPTHDK